MKTTSDSCKLAIIYVMSYIFIFTSIALGVTLNEMQRVSKIVNKSETYAFVTQEESQETPQTKDSLMVQKTFRYEALTTINDNTSGDAILDQAPSTSTKEIAQKIMDGSLVKALIFNTNFLSEDNKIGLLQFSGDMFVNIQPIPASGDVLLASGEFISGENISGEGLIEVNPEGGSEFIVVEEPQEVTEEPLDVDGVPTNYVRYIDCQATAYCLCQKCTGKTPNSPGYGRTASGYVITPGMGEKIIAVDRNMISLGTHVYVEGLNGAQDYGYALAADTGGAIKNHRIDLYMDSHQDCLKWGRRQVRVYILPD